MTSRRERLVWSLVFSVPPAIGMSLATAKVGARTILAPLVGGVFLVTTVVLFSFMWIASGDPDDAHDENEPDTAPDGTESQSESVPDSDESEPESVPDGTESQSESVPDSDESESESVPDGESERVSDDGTRSNGVE